MVRLSIFAEIVIAALSLWLGHIDFGLLITAVVNAIVGTENDKRKRK